MNIDIIEILNTYGLPTALALLFIWFYKQSSDKYNNFLKDTIKEQSSKAEKSEEILKELRDMRLSIEDSSTKINELQKTIMSYLLKDKE